MNLSPTARCEMYRQIRTVLVRHFIDIGRLSIHISAMGVNLHGTLTRLPGVSAPLTPEIVATILREIKRAPGVRRVDAEFDNWRQAEVFGAWSPVIKGEAVPDLPSDLSPPTVNLDSNS